VSLEAEARTRLGAFELDVAVRVAAGECLALAGRSGAGKSTLLRIVGGLLRPDRGSVRCDGHTWLDSAAKLDLPPEKRQCGFVFQDYALFDHMTAWQNVAYGLREVPRSERRLRAEALLDRFGLGARGASRPSTLSGGERQRVAVARALVTGPQVVFADEPTATLHRADRAHVLRTLASAARSHGITIVLATSDPEIARHGDRTTHLVDGRPGSAMPVQDRESASPRPASV
jgi:ABC-type sulfate/molybdate transport systems ATPase subunit